MPENLNGEVVDVLQHCIVVWTRDVRQKLGNAVFALCAQIGGRPGRSAWASKLEYAGAAARTKHEDEEDEEGECTD